RRGDQAVAGSPRGAGRAVSWATRASVSRLGYDRGLRALVDLQGKDIRPGIMTDDIEVEFSTADSFQIEVRGQDGLAAEIRAGKNLAERADDRAASAHQHGIGRVAQRHAHRGREGVLANELARGQHEEAPFAAP